LSYRLIDDGFRYAHRYDLDFDTVLMKDQQFWDRFKPSDHQPKESSPL
tara:strand:- start:1022 stop:1165 length:144 start_codon:yes stop_codon:yes gene_type:complete